MAKPVDIEKLISKMVLKNDDKITAVLKGLSPEDADAIKAALKVIQSMGDKVDPEVAQQLMTLIDKGAAPDTDGDAAQAALVQQAAELPAMKVRAEKAEADYAAMKAAQAQSDMKDGFPIKKDGTLDDEKIPEAIRPTLKALWGAKQESDAKLAKVQKSLDDERDQRVTKEYEDKASAFSHLAIKKEDLGKVLKAVAVAAPTSYDSVEKVLKAANEAVKKADPTKEIGSNQPGADGSAGSYEQMIEAPAMAQPIAKESGMSKDAAVTHFITKTLEGRKAYSEYRTKQESK